MKVVLVHDRDPHVLIGQTARGGDAGEAAADHDDVRQMREIWELRGRVGDIAISLPSIVDDASIHIIEAKSASDSVDETRTH